MEKIRGSWGNCRKKCATTSHHSWKLLPRVGTWRGRNGAKTCRCTAKIWSSCETPAKANRTLLLGRSKLVLRPSSSLLEAQLVWGWPTEHISVLAWEFLCACFVSVNTLTMAGNWHRRSYNSIEIRLFVIKNVWPIRNMRLLYLI